MPSRSAAPLNVAVSLTRGSFEITATFCVEPGRTLGLIGPNGAGKSSIAAAIAGNIPIDSGEVRIGDRIIDRREAGAPRVCLPRSDRRVGYLDQRARLFPHLTVQDNIAFGLRAQGTPKSQANEIAADWLQRIGLEGRGTARPAQLSGGQQQRVAIARTLCASPAVVILDEPFAALDVTNAAEIRALVRTELQRLGAPTILITHDAVDLMALADQVGVLEAGSIHQYAPLTHVARHPKTRFAAEFMGRTLLAGVASDRGSVLIDSSADITHQLGNHPVAPPEIWGDGDLPVPGGAAVVTYRPSVVTVSLAPTKPSELGAAAHDSLALNPDSLHWVDTVTRLTTTQSGISITTRSTGCVVAEVSLETALNLGLHEGQSLAFRLATKDVSLSAAPTRND